MFNVNYAMDRTPNNTPFMPYTPSEIEALVAGYVEVADERAYRGRCFIRGGKKWIHNIGALRAQLVALYGRYIDDAELSAKAPEGFGYDVANYYARHNQQSLQQDKQFQQLMENIRLH